VLDRSDVSDTREAGLHSCRCQPAHERHRDEAVREVSSENTSCGIGAEDCRFVYEASPFTIRNPISETGEVQCDSCYSKAILIRRSHFQFRDGGYDIGDDT